MRTARYCCSAPEQLPLPPGLRGARLEPDCPYRRPRGNLASKPALLSPDSAFPSSKLALGQNKPLQPLPCFGLQTLSECLKSLRPSPRRGPQDEGPSRVASNKRRTWGSGTRAARWTNRSDSNPGARSPRLLVFVRYSGVRTSPRPGWWLRAHTPANVLPAGGPGSPKE